MATEVVMPQMGESIAEGTITKWLKNVGDHVDRDEPLFEISTDKVDAEIPSPAAGTLTEIRFKEGDTVEINTIVAVLDGDLQDPPELLPEFFAKLDEGERVALGLIARGVSPEAGAVGSPRIAPRAVRVSLPAVKEKGAGKVVPPTDT